MALTVTLGNPIALSILILSVCCVALLVAGVNVQISGHVPMHTLRFGYFLTDATHPGSGTVENIRGSHRSMRNCTLLLSIFRRGPIQTH